LQFTEYSVRHHHLSLATKTNINWQKMSHLGSPANKRCAILKVGMFAVVNVEIIIYY